MSKAFEPARLEIFARSLRAGDTLLHAGCRFKVVAVATPKIDPNHIHIDLSDSRGGIAQWRYELDEIVAVHDV